MTSPETPEKRMTPVPVFVVEEHHEAFIVWHEAIRGGLLRPANRNVLLHVDAHSDMRTDCFRSPIPDSSCSAEAIEKFAYEELIISSFIIPALYQKVFYEVCWLLPPARAGSSDSGPKKGEKQYYYVRTRNEDRKAVIVQRDPFQGFTDRFWEDRSPFCFYHQTTAEPFSTESAVVLDIDLDYFSSLQTVDAFDRIEITVEEYERCRTEKYRQLNLHFRHYLEVVDGRYYLCLTPSPRSLGGKQQKRSQAEILSSLENFSRFLETNQIAPAFVDICRSRYSGYTPDPDWQFIEEYLLGQLGRLYELKVERI